MDINNIKFIEDDHNDIQQKAQMYYHLCTWDDLEDDFDDSWIKTRLSFYDRDHYEWTIAKSDNSYIWFVTSKSIKWSMDYIYQNYGLDLLKNTLKKLYNEDFLDGINYIDWLYVYPEYRREHT